MAYHGYNHHTLESLTQIQTKGFLVGAIVMERVSVQKNSRTRFTKLMFSTLFDIVWQLRDIKEITILVFATLSLCQSPR